MRDTKGDVTKHQDAENQDYNYIEQSGRKGRNGYLDLERVFEVCF